MDNFRIQYFMESFEDFCPICSYDDPDIFMAR